ncbi:MAG: hypothetical protein KGM24_02550, partial [Elusimicrobia bacterium]|nr:hypothetical protein [Elusimicrobiota bacterium]
MRPVLRRLLRSAVGPLAGLLALTAGASAQVVRGPEELAVVPALSAAQAPLAASIGAAAPTEPAAALAAPLAAP